MRLFSTGVFLLTLAATVAPQAAWAGDACTVNRGPITCGSVISSTTDVGFGDWFSGGWLQSSSYMACPTPVSGKDYPQDVYLLTCAATGRMRINVSPGGCDLDLFVVGPETCNADAACVASGVRGGNAPETQEFTCERGKIYYVSVEMASVNTWPWEDCNRFGGFDYTIDVKCLENDFVECNDLFDNDYDNLIDCLDPDCPPCKEQCEDGKDNDFDTKIDCDDEDCIEYDICCDKDGDNYKDVDGVCGGNDCNDDPIYDGFFIHPDAPELPADGIDQNCDGIEQCFVDHDLDNYGIKDLVEGRNFSCIGIGISDRDDDCNDSDPATHPDAVEILADGIDQNCDGKEDCYLDMDGDNFGSNTVINTSNLTCIGGGAAKVSGDCDDQDRFVFPGAVEFPVDGKDSNCDGTELCFEDRDGDAYGRTTTKATTYVSCIGPGVSPNNADCNDDPATNGGAIYPFATEQIADGVDQNCDGLEDCWRDGDQDSYGNDYGQKQASQTFTCLATGVSPNSSDCNDGNVTIYPGAADAPGDGIDQNCDGLQDCFKDVDGDTYGSSTYISSAVPNCSAPGISNRSGDCDDNNRAVNPGATEIPLDGIDLNCDGLEACYTDADGDAYGRDAFTNSSSFTCIAPGVAPNKTDCNDVPPAGAAIHPGATEIFNNGIDENCDNLEQCYQDADSDQHGTTTVIQSPSITCTGFGASNRSDDCNDADPRMYPGATEVTADNRDSDCDGFEICFRDVDQDHFGIASTVPSPSIPCSIAGVANNDKDCDDTRADVYPGAPNGPTGGVDYDCSGTVLCYQDLDGDSYGRNVQISSGGDPTCTAPGLSANNSDCNDDPVNGQGIHPNSLDLVNDGVDQDCDGFELCYRDQDADGYGGLNTQLSTDLQCNATGVSAINTDCNDNPAAGGATVYPNAPEIPVNGIDESCNGLEDCYIDLDVDKYGGQTKYPSSDLTCLGGSGYTNNKDDCDDTTPLRNPGKAEIPVNGFDENCDNADDCWQDLDGDRFGSTIQVASPYGLTCVGTGVAQIATDCYDVPPGGTTIYPGAPDVPGDGIDSNCDMKEACYVDTDRDGWGGTTTIDSSNLLCQAPGLSLQTGDCSDNDATVNPGVTETPANAKDQNCDGKEDCYLDQDLDTYGSTSIVQSAILTCTGAGFSPRNDDCYDLPPGGRDIHPGATDIVGSGIDEDCDGMESCWLDGDRDTFGRPVAGLTPVTDCSAPGYSRFSTDCNDANAQIFPAATETPADNKDQNCDGKEDCYRDVDGDLYGTPSIVQSTSLTCAAVGVAPNDDDCLDILPGGNFVNPGMTEIPGNGIDDNCDGAEVCFSDLDNDGFGGTGTTSTPSFDCNAPGAASQGGDCNDRLASVNPDATEVPGNGIDEDCDLADDCYLDRDQDSFGTNDPTGVIPGNDLDCSDPSESAVNTDCLDVGSINSVPSRLIFPTAPEVCNGVDDDCDSLVDDADPNVSSVLNWYTDADRDTFGSSGSLVARCVSPGAGYVTAAGDCNDANAAINPNADEVCDPLDVDENCNGVSDSQINPGNNKVDAIDAFAWYPDVDRDLYGDMSAIGVLACDPIGGRVEDHTDCDDTNANKNPGRNEVPYNGIDDDCDLSTPDDDLDGDGFNHQVDCLDVPGIGVIVNPAASELTGMIGVDDDCDGKIDDGTIYGDDDGDGYAEVAGDCDDTNADAHPGALEGANGNNKDDDCDGKIDEGTTRVDDDDDGWSETQGDCNDNAPAVNPGANENMSNGIDDDCDGSVDGGTYDQDRDGYTALGGDCDEDDGQIYPGAPELPNQTDDDCDGVVDEGTEYFDDDGDGFSETDGDCHDADELIFPGQDEAPGGVPNGIDDDCDEAVDEGTDASDDDGDGLSEYQGDCDDAIATVRPGNDEVANNGLDDDCDLLVDETEADKDGDGYLSVEAGCVETDSNCDCDDDDGWTNPGAEDICDDIDNDCNGVVDGDATTGEFCLDGPVIPPGPVCGCDDSSGGPSRLFMVPAVMALLALRRRQRPSVTR